MKPQSNEPTILLQKASSTEDIQEAVSLCLDKFRILDRAANSDRIIIKPNLCKPLPSESGATCDLRILESLIEQLKDANPRVLIQIVESDGLRKTAEEFFEGTGCTRLTRFPEVQLVNLSKTARTRVRHENLRFFKNGLSVPSVFLDSDLFMSVAKLKTHEYEMFSGILKNQFGCLPQRNKDQFHPFLAQVISEINMVLKPDLGIIDGIVGMEGRGPVFGEPRRMDLLISGTDPVATDSMGAFLIGFQPRQVPAIRRASEIGLGISELARIKVEGETPQSLRTEFRFIPKRSLLLLRAGLRTRSLAKNLTSINSGLVTLGRDFERLGRATHRRSLRKTAQESVLPKVTKKIRMPRVLHTQLVLGYLKLKMTSRE